jgi:hypothetical protein
MFPRMIEVVVGIVAAGVVPNPLVVGVDVRRLRVPALIRVRGMFRSGMRCASDRSRAVRGNMSTAQIGRAHV